MNNQPFDRLIELTMAEVQSMPAARSPRWTQSEKNFLQTHLVWTDVQIGEALGRSPVGVKIKRQRMYLQVVSKVPGWLTANKARDLLGMNDTRPVIGWIRKGLIAGKQVGLTEQRRWILPLNGLRSFVADPKNWVHFNKDKVQDPELRRLIHLGEKRFKDEWLTTRQAADLLGLTTRDVTRCIKLSRLHGVQSHNRDGRKHVNDIPRWAYWFVLKSEVLAMPAVKPRGHALPEPSADMLSFIHLAAHIGLSAERIGRLVGRSAETIVHYVRDYRNIKIEDWRQYRGNFPSLDRAARAYARGRASNLQLTALARILTLQARNAGLRKVRRPAGRVSIRSIDALSARLRAHNIEPYL